ncbi:MAG: hypothetical protein WB564_07705 [Dehalococcoidia bacterium]
MINQTTTGMLERRKSKNVVAQFIGQGRPDESGNYKCIENDGKLKDESG